MLPLSQYILTPQASDNFNRADESPLSGGGVWEGNGVTSQLDLSGNQVVFPLDTADFVSIYDGSIVWERNQYSRAKMSVVGGTANNQGPGVVCRSSNAAYTCYFCTVCDFSSGTIVVGRINAGTFTNLMVKNSSAWTDTDILTLITLQHRNACVYLAAYVNDNFILEYFDTGASIITAAGQPGLIYSSTVTSVAMDDWDAGTVTRPGDQTALGHPEPAFQQHYGLGVIP